MWPNDANRIVYPQTGPSAPLISKPTPLTQETVDRHASYVKEHKALTEKKQTLEDKCLQLGKQLDAAENVKGFWTRKDQGLIKRLTAESNAVKTELDDMEKKLNSLIMTNETLVSAVSIYESCVKGYDEYLIWKEQINREIHEIFKTT